MHKVGLIIYPDFSPMNFAATRQGRSSHIVIVCLAGRRAGQLN